MVDAAAEALAQGTMTDDDQPRVLAIYYNFPHRYARPMYSAREILAGPRCDTAYEDGRMVTLNVPRGPNALADILARIPEDQQPEVIVVNIDSSLLATVYGLAASPGRKVLMVGDSHHGDRMALRRILGAVEDEPYDHVMTTFTKHHSHWFAKAGLPRPTWAPLPHIRIQDRPPCLRDDAGLDHDVLFLGRVGGAWHQFRNHAVAALETAGIDITAKLVDFSDMPDHFLKARISLNISLNGDLNQRIFEVLAAGGFLLTDRLAPEAGLEDLFTDGEHLAIYDGLEDLVDKVRHYLAHPTERERIRRAGQQRVLETLSADHKRRIFRATLRGTAPVPPFAVTDARTEDTYPGWRGDLGQYEVLQDLHCTGRVVVHAPHGLPTRWRDAIRDLPRLRVVESTAAPADLTTLDRQVLALPGGLDDRALCRSLATFPAPTVMITDGGGGDTRLTGLGYAPMADHGGCYETDQPAALVGACLKHGLVEEAQRRACALLPTVTDWQICVAWSKVAADSGLSEMRQAALARLRDLRSRGR